MTQAPSALLEGLKERLTQETEMLLARQSFPDYHRYVHQRDFYRHQLVWGTAMQDPQEPRVVFIAPPESFKSSTTRPFIEWTIGQNPNVRNLLLMNTATQAEKQVMSIAETIEKNPRYRQVFPHIQPDPKRGWSHDTLFVKRPNSSLPDPTLYGTGIDGPYQGTHVENIFIDDPTDPQDVQSASIMEAQRQRVRGVVLDRLVEGGKLFVILTRWGMQDLVPTFREMGFKVIENPVKGRYPWGELLCPEMWPQERLDRLLHDKGQSLYDLTYMCDPEAAAKERSFFDPAACTEMRDYDCMEPRETRQGVIKVWRKPVVAARYVGFGDVAWGEKGAYSVFVLEDFQSRDQVAEVYGRPTLDENALLIHNLVAEYGRVYFGIEANGEGRKVVDKLIELGDGDKMFHRDPDWRNKPEKRGYWTDDHNRPLDLNNLEEAVRLRQFIPRCREAVGEFMSFQRSGKRNRPDAAEGAYSDHVMAYKGLVAIRGSARFGPMAGQKQVPMPARW